MCHFCCFLWDMLHSYLMVDCIRKWSAKHSSIYKSFMPWSEASSGVTPQALYTCSNNWGKGISFLSDLFPALFWKGKVCNRGVSSASSLSCAQQVLASRVEGASLVILQPWACLKLGEMRFSMAFINAQNISFWIHLEIQTEKPGLRGILCYHSVVATDGGTAIQGMQHKWANTSLLWCDWWYFTLYISINWMLLLPDA